MSLEKSHRDSLKEKYQLVDQYRTDLKHAEIKSIVQMENLYSQLQHMINTGQHYNCKSKIGIHQHVNLIVNFSCEVINKDIHDLIFLLEDMNDLFK